MLSDKKEVLNQKTLASPMEKDSKELLGMENFREAVLEFASSDPNKPLTEARISLIDKRIRELSTHIRTPDHPTYRVMIHRAIEELNEEGGCSEESISNFIRKEYNDLPWAHSTFLNHHLEKLCESGEIFMTLDNSYYLHADTITNQNPSFRSQSKEPKTNQNLSFRSQSKEQKTKGRKKEKQGRKRGRLQSRKDEIEEE